MNTSAVLVDLNEVLTFGFNPLTISFSPYLPGFLRDQYSLRKKLVGLIFPFESNPDFDWSEQEEFASSVMQKLKEKKSPDFKIICLKDREDPAPLWALRRKANISLGGCRYFTGISSCLTFVQEAGITYFDFFPATI